jgi:diguanylate cyclase (GGDEF)-like protein
MTERIAPADLRPPRTVEWAEPVHRSRPVQVFTAVVVGAAVVAAVLGILLSGHSPVADPLPALVRVGLATVVVAAGQLARLRFQLGRGAVSVSWGEAAFLLGFALAPRGWLPAATMVGAGCAWLLISWLAEHRPWAEIVHLAASLSLGAAGGAVVATAVAGGAAPSSGRGQIALIAGAGVYLLITFALAAATLALRRDATVREIVIRIVYAKVPVFVGNVLVGLVAVFVLAHDPLWLLAFPPALWLLQRSYRYHLRAEDERRTWKAFARATATLPGAAESEVVAAGLRGALDVFRARRVEMEVLRADGRHRRYAQDAPGEDVDTSGLPGPVITRSMAVAGAPVGELTVWFAEPILPAARDELAVSAYADVLAGALHDAAARERFAALDARSSHDAVHDPLTGLLNRAALLAHGDELLRSLGRDRSVALLLLDLNHFREVNGALGHRAGDEVLTIVAQRITDLCRDGELMARLGDDEFAVYVPAAAALADSATVHTSSPVRRALHRARDLIDALAQPMSVQGVRLAVESAVGIAVGKAGHADTAELVRRATLALDEAKQQRLGIAAYDSSREPSSPDHLAVLAELRDALGAHDQIMLALQPAVDLKTGAPTGVEALTRWRHPRRGQLAPTEFIDTVEHSELLAPFTRYVLDLSLAVAASWLAEGFDVPVSVNVSSRSLLDTTLPAEIDDLLRSHGVPAHRLVLEITESIPVSELEIVDDVLTELRDMGVQLSVDDFGTGFSSLSFVTRVRVDELKVDRSFVEAMTDSAAATAVVRGAVELGDRLGARVVAEGVETAEQRLALLKLGCVSAQGFHFCQPLPTDKIIGALRQLNDAAAARVLPLRADDAS